MTAVKYAIGSTYIKTMNGLSRLGEKLGWEWLVYNPLVHIAFERSARRNAPPMVRAIREMFPAVKTVVDVGAGTGTWSAEFQRGGFNVVACEYSAKLRRKASAKGVNVKPFDLSKSTQPLPGAPFDLAISTEVAEHIPESLADAMVQYMANSGRLIVFTAAQPGQGGTGHINEQPREYWQEKFAKIGCEYLERETRQLAEKLRTANTQSFVYDNLSVLRSPSSTSC